jgi:hypothetical protein
MPLDYRQTIAKFDETIASYKALLTTDLTNDERDQIRHVIQELLVSRGVLQLRMDAAEMLRGPHFRIVDGQE